MGLSLAEGLSWELNSLRYSLVKSYYYLNPISKNDVTTYTSHQGGAIHKTDS